MAAGDIGRRIPEPIVPDERNELVRFSFKYIDFDSNEFGPHHCNEEFLRAFLRKLREYSSWPLDTFSDMNNREHRHIIDWRETRFPEGFPNVSVDQLAYHEAWQFELTPFRIWRVYGVLLEDTFFVIWLDSNHNLYVDNG